MKKFSIALIVLMFASLACSFSFGTPGGSTTTGGGTVLYSDDFSNVKSGWDRTQADYKYVDYSNGGYRVWVSRTQYDVWGLANRSFDGPIAIEVDATKIGGPDDNDFGVICRYTKTSDAFSFYYFIISSDGYAVIGRVLNGSQEWISSDQMLSSSAIRRGAATNRIRAECIGSNLALYVNGQLVASVTDTSLPESGDVGLMAGTFNEGGTDILFDNFVVMRP